MRYNRQRRRPTAWSIWSGLVLYQTIPLLLAARVKRSRQETFIRYAHFELSQLALRTLSKHTHTHTHHTSASHISSLPHHPPLLLVHRHTPHNPPLPSCISRKTTGLQTYQLGIPTANLPVDATVTPWIEDAKSGVYFGWASLELPKDHPNAASTQQQKFAIFPMVMSIGYNPFYNNTVRSAEVHVLDNFGADFYGVEMRLLILGYIRDEQSYDGVEALIEDIKMDCEVAKNSLNREAWKPAGENGGKLDGAWLTR